VTEKVSLRETYGKTLAELGRENPDIVALDADLCKSTMTKFFAAEFPERTFDCGVAEANMVTIAAGLAAGGKIPFASTFAAFLPGRCFDQVRMSIGMSGLGVKLVSTHAGITVGEDGASHQAIEDLALITTLPGFTVIVPADAEETAQVIRAIAATEGPCYVRLPRTNLPTIYDENYKFEIGKASVLREGTDVAILAIGTMVAEAMKAAEELQESGINCKVVNMSTIKPIDEAAIVSAAATGAIVTAEEHLEHGGLGSIVATVLAKNHPVIMEMVSMEDGYAGSGKPDELLEAYGLTAEAIANAARMAMVRKTGGGCQCGCH